MTEAKAEPATFRLLSIHSSVFFRIPWLYVVFIGDVP
jgi:hypothetical protein